MAQDQEKATAPGNGQAGNAAAGNEADVVMPARRLRALRHQPLGLLGYLGLGLIASVPIGALSVAAVAGSQPATETVEPRSNAPVWRASAARHGGFDLDAPRWRPLGLKISVLRRSDGVTRELFLFGEATGDQRHAAMAIDRGDTGSAPAEQDIGALVADLGLPARLRPNHQALDTKFGPLPTIDIAIDGPAGPKACLGFALRSAEARLRVVGWVCNAGPEIVSRADASCFIDRLVTIGAGDQALAGIFVRAELNRQPCGAIQPGVTAGASRPFQTDGQARLRLRRL
ncbi:hypothetical protein [Phreatobacter stygius]|uniref:Uncharacterized protein n=1 Tax=Phreatobacter stygius TaxID=1940610 RepID=A0A4D7B8Z9_9HYPH|nr:hypothetical protein [Phreatobacter stygius]QCI64567.1 hypothetical protein E8M01_10190 [Phreatobacter stygius]